VHFSHLEDEAPYSLVASQQKTQKGRGSVSFRLKALCKEVLPWSRGRGVQLRMKTEDEKETDLE
jgi:hypothetical protein